MTIIVPVQSELIAEDSAVALARYARVVEYPECPFWGINKDTENTGECRAIWSKTERDTIAKYLAEAQFEIEEVCGYFLSPRWVVGLLADEDAYGGDERYVDSQSASRSGRQQTRWPKIITAGIRAVEDIDLDSPVDHASDPAVIGPISTTVTDPDEIMVYHPDTNVPIVPSKITFGGGAVTIEIPRCRMVTEECADNPSTGIDYADVGACDSSTPVEGCFECFVDVKRVYTDPRTNAKLIWPHRCSASCLASGCADKSADACIYIRNSERGEIDVRPSTWNGERWNGSGAACCSGQPEIVRLNYRAGAKVLSKQAEDAIVRLAHAKMPDAPCGCATTQRLWERDRNIPEVLDAQRLQCPFGLNDGSWIAFKFANSMRLWRGSVL